MDARRRWTLILTSVASLMVSLDMLVVVTALNTIRLDLGASIAELDWTVNAFTLAVATALLTATAVGDRLGRRRMLVAGLALFTASSAACALAPSIGVLVAARAVQGAGTAIVLPQALALVSAAFPPAQRGKAMGTFAGITGLAILSGPVIGGAVVQGLAWQWIFWLNVPIGIALIPLAARRVGESFGPRRPLDAGDLALSSAGSLGLVWGLVRGNDSGWGSPQVYGPLLAGAALLAVFGWWERRTRSPMVPVSLFRNASFVSANASSFLMGAAMFGAAFFIAEYLQAGLGAPPLTAGLRMLPWTATLFLVAPLAGRLVNRLGERRIVVAGAWLPARRAGCGKSSPKPSMMSTSRECWRTSPPSAGRRCAPCLSAAGTPGNCRRTPTSTCWRTWPAARCTTASCSATHRSTRRQRGHSPQNSPGAPGRRRAGIRRGGRTRRRLERLRDDAADYWPGESDLKYVTPKAGIFILQHQRAR